MPELTPFQTVGPFFAILPLEGENAAATRDAQGQVAMISGVVRDGAGSVVPDALIETWQADGNGKFDAGDPAFRGFARSATDASGRFEIRTVKPGAVADPDNGLQSPHLLVSVLARGILTRLVTRLYFGDDPTIATDPILALVPEHRRATLLAQRTEPNHYRFDIRLQGEGETVFFDL